MANLLTILGLRRPRPLGHGFSPRPEGAGTCGRCGAKEGYDCAVLTAPDFPSGQEALERAIASVGPEWADAADWLAGRVMGALADDPEGREALEVDLRTMDLADFTKGAGS